MRHALAHPHWCAASYRCTAGYPDGEHASRPCTVPAAGSRAVMVVTMFQRRADAMPTVEIRLRVRLAAGDEARQLQQVRRLMVRMGTAVKEVAP